MKTMFQKLTFTLCTLLIAASLFAQRPSNQGQSTANASGSIKGTVIDALNSNGVDYANIVLFKAKDSTMLNGTITNEKGAFRLEKVPFGKYYLKITFIGYKTLKVPDITIKPGEQDKDLGTLKFEPSAQTLGEVQVVGEKKLVEYKLDKKVVNVDRNITSTGGTAVDVLQNVPSVTVDQDGAVSLRGNSNVTILIDGRPSSITGTNLQQIAASSIENVEVITNPSARYNPEGMTGIININLKKKKALGLNGMATLSAGTGDRYSGSVNLNLNLSKVNLFGSLDIRSDRRPGEHIKKTDYITLGQYLTENSEGNRKGLSQSLKLGADFFLNAKNTLTFTWMTNQNNSESWDKLSALNVLKSNQSIVNQYETDASEKGKRQSYDYTLNYRKTFDQKGRELTADAIYSKDKDEDDEFTDVEYSFLDGLATDSLEYKFNPQGDKTERLTLQANYIHPFGKDGRFEAGFQSVIRENTNWLDQKIRPNTMVDWKLDKQSSFTFNDQVHAAYATYGNSFGKFSYQLGLRLEQWSTEGIYAKDSTFKNTYFNFYPTLHLSRKITESQEIQLSYSRRVNRPRSRMLNPFPDNTTPKQIFIGKPDLKQEDIHALELGHSIFWNKSAINTTVFYRYVGDVINRTIEMQGDTTIISFANQESAKSYGIEMVIDQQIFKWWRMNANYSYFRTEVTGNESTDGATNSNYSYTAKLSSNVFLPNSFMIQLTGFYRGPMVTAQGEMKPMFSTDIAVKKDFFKNKISVNLRLSDIFKTMKFGMKNYSSTSVVDMTRKFDSRVLYLSVSYKINEGLKQKGKKPTTNNNDNMMDGGDF
jgi:outer membrane receptor protein involved in Fe transport